MVNVNFRISLFRMPARNGVEGTQVLPRLVRETRMWFSHPTVPVRGTPPTSRRSEGLTRREQTGQSVTSALSKNVCKI